VTAKVDELLGIVGLQGYQARYPSQLSGGQRPSAWRSPARWPSSRACCCSDEPFGALDAKVRAELRAWLAPLHDEVHVTTGARDPTTRRRRWTSPIASSCSTRPHRADRHAARALRAPRNGFVMSFLGPVARLGEALVRPHDLRVTSEPREGALEAMVDRVVHLGFEVRAELRARRRRAALARAAHARRRGGVGAGAGASCGWGALRLRRPRRFAALARVCRVARAALCRANCITEEGSQR